MKYYPSKFGLISSFPLRFGAVGGRGTGYCEITVTAMEKQPRLNLWDQNTPIKELPRSIKLEKYVRAQSRDLHIKTFTTELH